MNLSTFYRQILNSGKAITTIMNEIELSRAYLEIMCVRYHNKFHYTIICPENLYPHSCLKLLLQTLIENSIYHGIKELDKMGEIQIVIEEISHNNIPCISFKIIDNCVGFNKGIAEIMATSNSHFGIKNIQTISADQMSIDYEGSIKKAEEQISKIT